MCIECFVSMTKWNTSKTGIPFHVNIYVSIFCTCKNTHHFHIKEKYWKYLLNGSHVFFKNKKKINWKNISPDFLLVWLRKKYLYKRCWRFFFVCGMNSQFPTRQCNEVKPLSSAKYPVRRIVCFRPWSKFDKLSFFFFERMWILWKIPHSDISRSRATLNEFKKKMLQYKFFLFVRLNNLIFGDVVFIVFWVQRFVKKTFTLAIHPITIIYLDFNKWIFWKDFFSRKKLSY